MKSFKRSDRVSGQILRDLSLYLDNELSEKIHGMVTFTHVKLSNDLRYATVYYSFLGDEDKRESVHNFLEQKTKIMRAYLSKIMNIRNIPELTMKFDVTIEEGIKIERLLNEINEESD